MANNRVRSLIAAIVFLILLILIIVAIFYFVRRNQQPTISDESCPRPKQYATDYDFDYTTRSNEFQNLNSTINYFRLSLSWSPSFCAHRKQAPNLFQCQNNFTYIVHGLWPNAYSQPGEKRSMRHHPRNCRNEQAMSTNTIHKYFCLMPSESLMQAEWEKHGTCYWSSPEEYFEQINVLYSNLQLPKNTEEILSNTTLTKAQRRLGILDSFLDINPQLARDNMQVIMIHKGKDLKEVAICYDLNFNYTKCG
ncbi:unnamed protein product [Adineta ricciae]|uniref:Uncharacterized protein n=1 Tax=Adineta ricciae TaxID=249248 RepID=A0A813WKL2_ADIRI|nr:unnamed protein product [Adineta ricciae]